MRGDKGNFMSEVAGPVADNATAAEPARLHAALSAREARQGAHFGLQRRRVRHHRHPTDPRHQGPHPDRNDGRAAPGPPPAFVAGSVLVCTQFRHHRRLLGRAPFDAAPTEAHRPDPVLAQQPGSARPSAWPSSGSRRSPTSCCKPATTGGRSENHAASLRRTRSTAILVGWLNGAGSAGRAELSWAA